MFKKSLLLFLMSTNLSASWRYEDTGIYIIGLSFLVTGVTKAIKDFQKKVEDQKKKSDQDLPEISSEQSLEDLQASIKTLETAQIVAVTMFLTLVFPALYCILQDEYHKIFPTEEQKIAHQKADEYLQVRDAQVKFSRCLFNSDYKSPRDNDFNCPKNCKELLDIFIKHGGQDTALAMIQGFDQCGEKTC